MSTAYDVLLRKVEGLATNPQYQQTANMLISDGFTMQLENLMRINTLEQPYLECFKYLLAFLKYLSDPPKPSESNILSQHYTYVCNIIPQDCVSVVLPFMQESFLGALSRELETEDPIELRNFLKTYSYLKSQGVEIQSFEDNLSIKLTNILWDITGEQDKNILKSIEYVDLALHAQQNQFDLGDTVDLLVSSLYQFLFITYEMHNLGQRNDSPDVKKLVGVMKLLKLSETEKDNVVQLENFFGSVAPQSGIVSQGDSAQSQKRRSKKRFEKDPRLESKIVDINALIQKEIIYANSTDPNFSVIIFRMGCKGFDDVVLKVYEIKNPNYNIERIKNEIDILETLSKLAENSQIPTCFLRYFGSNYQQNKISLCMEYIPTTLMTELTRMKKDKQRFSEIEITTFTRDLIQAFQILENMRIYHQDIKPHNILVANNKKLKIIDFSVSAAKSYDEATIAATGLHFIQGTQGYMAPELQKYALSDKKEKVKYKRNKADVFSMGITLLQMYTLDDLLTLNFEENNEKLMSIVNQIPLIWFKTLLNKMLQIKHRERPSFKNCLKLIPGGVGPTTYQHTTMVPNQ